MIDRKDYFPLSVVRPRAEDLVRALAPSCVRIMIAGSVRRLRPEVADIEVVAVPKIETFERLVEEDLLHFKRTTQWNFLEEVLRRIVPRFEKDGERYKKFFYPLDEERRIAVDLFLATPDNFGLILFIRTGPAEYSKAVIGGRLRARGFCSHEGRVYHLVDGKPTDAPLSTPEEDDIFRLAGMKPVPPAERYA